VAGAEHCEPSAVTLGGRVHGTMIDESGPAPLAPLRVFLRRRKLHWAVLLLCGWWGLRLWRLRHSVGQYRSYWSVAQGEIGGILYVALGDSTAQGIGASAPERGYVGLIAQRLRSATGRPVQVLNVSRSGARVHDVVVEQLPRVAGLAPDLVTVAVGANDLKHYDPDGFRADVDALIASLGATTVVGDVPWFMHGGTGRK
jgi:lysophospholipase L1-like esterase